MTIQPEDALVLCFTVSLFVIAGIWLAGHWHEPCFTINMTEDFWGVCK